MENLDKIETLLCDHHFPQDARRFLLGVVVFAQPRGLAAQAAVPALQPRVSPCIGKSQPYTIPAPQKPCALPRVCDAGGGPGVGQPHREV